MEYEIMLFVNTVSVLSIIMIVGYHFIGIYLIIYFL
jgi:hypothetical protein